MKRLLIVAALAMTTLSLAGCCRNPCRPGLFGGGGLFGHRWNRDNSECCDMSYDTADTGCDACGGGPYDGMSGGEVILSPPPAAIGPPPAR